MSPRRMFEHEREFSTSFFKSFPGFFLPSDGRMYTCLVVSMPWLGCRSPGSALLVAEVREIQQLHRCTGFLQQCFDIAAP